MIADDAVMSDVRSNHQEIVVADTSVSSSALCAAMDIHVFAKLIVGANRQKGFLAMEFQILRLNSNDTEWEKPIGISNSRRAFDDDMESSWQSSPIFTLSPIQQYGPMELLRR